MTNYFCIFERSMSNLSTVTNLMSVGWEMAEIEGKGGGEAK